MKYAIKAVYLAIIAGDFISAWKLFIDIPKNAYLSDTVFDLFENHL